MRFFSGALTAREELVEHRRQLRLQHVLAVVGRVVLRVRAVEPVLLAQRDDHLVDQRVAETRDLHERDRLPWPFTEIARRSVVAQTPTTAFGAPRVRRPACRPG